MVIHKVTQPSLTNTEDLELGTKFTNEVLSVNSEVSLRDLKKRILEADRLRTIEKSDGHPSLFYVLCIANENKWMKFWDVALEHGYDGTKASMSILKLLCLTVFSDRNCPMHDCPYIVPQDMPLCEHFMECHTDFDPLNERVGSFGYFLADSSKIFLHLHDGRVILFQKRANNVIAGPSILKSGL